jgi:hypothetical protein
VFDRIVSFRVNSAVRLSLFLVAGSLLFSSCENDGSAVIDESGLPPRIDSPAISPAIVNTDTINIGPERLPDDLLPVKITARVRAVPSSGSPIGSVTIVYFQDPKDPEASASLHDDGVPPDFSGNDSVYTTELSLTIPRSQIGTSYIEFTATDMYGNNSNRARLPLSIVRLNQSPTISSLTAPDTVRPSVAQLFKITVQVQDPDGLSDIRSVTRKTPGGNVFPLNDNGVNGDDIAGDGIFSETVSLSPAPSPGSYTFTFQATDRSSATSNVLSHTVVVLQ